MVHSRIDYFLIQKEDSYRVLECNIGVADVSDHNAIYLTIKMDSRKKDTVWQLNLGILNNKKMVEEIKFEIKRYLEENDNGEINPSILWDTLKVVIRGKLIAKTAFAKKTRLETYNKLSLDLKDLEQQHKHNKSKKLQKQTKSVRRWIDDILGQEIEKKARFTKQAYYELGPKSNKLLAWWLCKQQAENIMHKIKDTHMQQLKYKPEEIECIFQEYYKELYEQTDSAEIQSMQNFLDSLDLPWIGESQNEAITAEITPEELKKAIGRLKTHKAPGSDGFPAEWYKLFVEELSPLLL